MRSASILACALALTACGSTTSPPETAGGDSGTDSAPALDASADARLDAALDSTLDATADTALDVPTDGACCLGHTLSWGSDGGLVAWTATSSLADCRTYGYTRTPSAGGSPLACSQELAGCGGSPLGVADVATALANPDVVAALASSTPLYGSDPRGCDGAVLRIQVDARTFEVGGDCSQTGCGGPSTCVPVPPGVATLAKLLGDLETQELARAQCKCVIGGQGCGTCASANDCALSPGMPSYCGLGLQPAASCIAGECTDECGAPRTCVLQTDGCVKCGTNAPVCPDTPCESAFDLAAGSIASGTCQRYFLDEIQKCFGPFVVLNDGSLCTIADVGSGVHLEMLACGSCDTVVRGP